jgi:hypothetical protein
MTGDPTPRPTPTPTAPSTRDPVPLGRPPIRQATVVRSGLAHTFDVFVDTIGQWWPLRPFSIGQERVRDVTFDRRVDGLVSEVWDDGRTVIWGRLLRWDPPTGFVMTWELLPAVTEVELAFRSLGPALTRVEVEHRGWEALTVDQINEATAVAGGYSAGWAAILASLARAAESPRHDAHAHPGTTEGEPS